MDRGEISRSRRRFLRIAGVAAASGLTGTMEGGEPAHGADRRTADGHARFSDVDGYRRIDETGERPAERRESVQQPQQYQYPAEPPGYSWMAFEDYRWRILYRTNWSILAPNSLVPGMETPRDRFHATANFAQTNFDLVVTVSSTEQGLDGAGVDHLRVLAETDANFRLHGGDLYQLPTGQMGFQYVSNRTNPYGEGSLGVSAITVEGERFYEATLTREITITGPPIEPDPFTNDFVPTIIPSFGVW